MNIKTKRGNLTVKKYKGANHVFIEINNNSMVLDKKRTAKLIKELQARIKKLA